MVECVSCVVGEVLLAIAAFFWIGCYLRVLPLKLMRFWFACVMLVNVIIMAGGTAVGEALRYVGVSRKVTKLINTMICRATFGCILYGTSQVRVHIDQKSWDLWCAIPNKTAMALNHTSFWDAFLFVGMSPVGYVSNAKTLMKDSLRRIPLFGGIFDRVGHFPVYFKSDEDGNFAVDKERQAPVLVAVQEHISAGGRITIFPEGAVNKTPRTLTSFRRGSFNIIKENAMPIYFFISVGNETTWPPGKGLGGWPADIYVSVNKFDDLDWEKDSPEAVAERLQIAMQKEVDRLYALRDAKKDKKKE